MPFPSWTYSHSFSFQIPIVLPPWFSSSWVLSHFMILILCSLSSPQPSLPKLFPKVLLLRSLHPHPELLSLLTLRSLVYMSVHITNIDMSPLSFPPPSPHRSVSVLPSYPRGKGGLSKPLKPVVLTSFNFFVFVSY